VAAERSNPFAQNVRAQQLFSKLLSDAEQARALQKKQWFDTALNYKLDWEDELDRRKQPGISGLALNPLPIQTTSRST
jgi:hypothetical protein